MDLPVPILPHPERPFGPRESRVTAAAGGRDRGEHAAGLRIDLLDAIRGELKQCWPSKAVPACRADRGRCDRLDRRLPPVHRLEGASPCLLPGGTRAQPYAPRWRRHGLATRRAPRTPLQSLLRPSDIDPVGSWTFA